MGRPGGGQVGVLALGGGSRPGQMRAHCWLSPRFPLPSTGSHPLLQVGVWGSLWKSCAADPCAWGEAQGWRCWAGAAERLCPQLGSPTKVLAALSSLASGEGRVWGCQLKKVCAPRETLPWQQKRLLGGARCCLLGGGGKESSHHAQLCTHACECEREFVCTRVWCSLAVL